MNGFKVGDIVQLKSGGPHMTITALEGNSVRCTWFVNDSPNYGVFEIPTVIKIED